MTLTNTLKSLGLIMAAAALTNAGAMLQTGKFDPAALAGASAGGAAVGLAGWLLKSPLKSKEPQK